MRIRISHETTIAFAPASRSTVVNLRLTPRSFDSQYVLRWRVGVDLDCALRHSEDALGNFVHSFSHQKPIERIVVSAIGEVETADAVGVVRGAEEPLPEAMFLRESAKASANAKLREFVYDTVAGGTDNLDRLHKLMDTLHAEIAHDAEAHGGAAEALSLKRGSAVDITHLFLASARALDIPARFVTGYVAPADGDTAAQFDVWAEALTPGLGWVAFDCLRDLCPNDRYVRVGLGFDYPSAQPIRLNSSGGGPETFETLVRIQGAASQTRSQSQRQA